MGRLRRWHIAILALVVIVAVIAAVIFTLNPFGLNPLDSEDENALAPTERLLPVRFDSLTTEIAINGSIAFSNKEDLTFGSAGFVAEMLVSEGEIVSEGQPLARLDPESAANLRKAIAQAQLDHEDAIDALADAQMPTLRIAEAEAALADAELEAQNAQETLDELLNPGVEVVAQAESTLADAKLEVQSVQETLDELLNPGADAAARAQETIAQAQVALRDSQHSLDNDFVSAQTELELAERELAVAKMLLDDPANAGQLAEAREVFELKETDYANVIYKWTGVSATSDDLAMSPQELFAALDFNPEVVYSRDYPLFEDNRIVDNPNTRWNELRVFGWRALYPGYSLIESRCEHLTLLPERDSDTTNTNAELCIERDLENAWESLQTARDNLQSAETEFNDSAAKLKERHVQAFDARKSAQDKVDGLQSGSADDELLRKKFTAARENLNKAKQDLEDLLNPNDVEIASLRDKLALAEAKQDTAADALRELLNPNAGEVAAKRNALELAQAKRNEAAQDLQKIHDRRELEIALQEATVAMAQAKIEGEMRRYEDSTLTAPWDGYIASIPVEVGQEVEPFEVILTVINSGIVNVEGSVDEIDVLFLRREEPVTVTIDALPDEELKGVISNISSTSTNEQGVVSFDVTIRVVVPEGVTLQEGLSAVARVATAEERGIVIPMQSVQFGDQGAFVRKEDENGDIIEHPVTLGSGDGFYTIVEDGLMEGDRIVMQALDEGQFEEDSRFRMRGGPPGRGGRPPRR